MNESQRHLLEGGGEQILAAVGKASPPIAVSTAAASGFSLQDWVLIATLVYTALLTVHLLYKFARDLRGGRDRADV